MECPERHPKTMRHTNGPTLMLLIWEVQLRIVNFNIFSPNNITFHNLQHHVVFSSPDFPANITLQPLSGLMLSAKVCLNTSLSEHKFLPCFTQHSMVCPPD